MAKEFITCIHGTLSKGCRTMPELASIVPFEGLRHSTPTPLPPIYSRPPWIPTDPLAPFPPPHHTGRMLGGGDLRSRICYSCSVPPHKSLTSCLFLIFFLLRKKRSKGLGLMLSELGTSCHGKTATAKGYTKMLVTGGGGETMRQDFLPRKGFLHAFTKQPCK